MAHPLHSLTVGTLLAFMIAGQSPAQDAERPADRNMDAVNEKFRVLDGNADGMISRMEAHGDEDVENQFPSLDRDADGDLDKTEFSAFEVREPRRAAQPPGGRDGPDRP